MEGQAEAKAGEKPVVVTKITITHGEMFGVAGKTFITCEEMYS